MLGKQITLNDMESVVSKGRTLCSHHRPCSPSGQASGTTFTVTAVMGTVTLCEQQGGGIACQSGDLPDFDNKQLAIGFQKPWHIGGYTKVSGPTLLDH